MQMALPFTRITGFIKRANRFALIAGLASLLGACTSTALRPAIDYNPDYNFAAIKSYTFANSKTDGPQSLDDTRIERAISQQMLSHGINPVPNTAKDKASVQLHFALITSEKQELQTYGGVYPGGFIYDCWRCGRLVMVPEVDVVHYTEGQLVVDMVDSKTNRSIWHAESVGRVPSGLNPQQKAERINGIIASMFAQFPPLQ